MDQDFHYYGTYYAARLAGRGCDDATRIAKASNFIDFLNNSNYGGFWQLVRNRTRPAQGRKYDVTAVLENPRYAFQGSLSLGIGEAEDGLWGSFHFTPGNYEDPEDSPSDDEVHGRAVAQRLPGHRLRRIDSSVDPRLGRLLNRPQSALSRAMILDTIACLRDEDRLDRILAHALGQQALRASPRRDDILRRFGLLLLGARAHVIADTWAHQDWSCVNHEINTYYDVNDDPVGRQSIDYALGNGDWTNVVLSSLSHDNLKAVPNGTLYIGHGWMGHLPDYSFLRYRYKPCWRGADEDPVVRDNRIEYASAFLELCSLFAQARPGGRSFQPARAATGLVAAREAIHATCDIADASVCPRVFSSQQWLSHMNAAGIEAPTDRIDARNEQPDPLAVLPGQLQHIDVLGSRFGHYFIDVESDLYLFQIAVDYHFQFVSHYLASRDIYRFSGRWSQADGPLSSSVRALFE